MLLVILDLVSVIVGIGLILMGGAIFAWLIHDAVERRRQ